MGSPPPARAHARRTDPQTSHDAATSLGDLRESQRSVLYVLRKFGPSTDERLVENYQAGAALGRVPRQSESGIRTRRKELTEAGLVRDSGDRAILRSGRSAIIWESV